LVVTALVLALALASLVRGGQLTSATTSGLEAGEADRVVEAITGMPIATTLIVHFRSADLDPTGEEFQAEMARALEPLTHDERVLTVRDPRNAPAPLMARMVSPRSRAAFA